MKNYKHKAMKVFYGWIGLLIVTLIALLLSCEKEQCFICDVERPDMVVLSSGVYVRWEYMKQETFCDGIPTSDPLPRSINDSYFEARRYTNCNPY